MNLRIIPFTSRKLIQFPPTTNLQFHSKLRYFVFVLQTFRAENHVKFGANWKKWNRCDYQSLFFAVETITQTKNEVDTYYGIMETLNFMVVVQARVTPNVPFAYWRSLHSKTIKKSTTLYVFDFAVQFHKRERKLFAFTGYQALVNDAVCSKLDCCLFNDWFLTTTVLLFKLVLIPTNLCL